MTETRPSSAPPEPGQASRFPRFERSQRAEHIILLVSFTVLALTGLPQMFAATPPGELMLRLLGGIETARQIHRLAAILLLGESIFHVIMLLYRGLVKRVSLSILPLPDDFRHLLDDLKAYLGLRPRKASYGRYSYAEKVEYLAVVWGTLIMAVTGFMMWNPISTARWLPGAVIPAAKTAHGNEAVLAVLSILIWHFYHVHIRHFNKSMFTGYLTRKEMEEEHAAELAAIELGRLPPPPPAKTLRRRTQVFIPAAALLTVALSFGLFKFITFEETAITTIPPAESAPVFVPQTPTPVPTSPPTPTSAGVSAASWEGGFAQLFRNRCSTCHGQTAVSGLSLATYAEALVGGNQGPAIVVGDPDASILVQVQSTGKHPGQLTIDELQQVIDWIKAGAPER